MACPHCETDKQIVICEGCPCENTDYEYGAWCNLGYDPDNALLGYSKFCDGEWHRWSDRCGLIKVVTEDGEEDYTPSPYKIEKDISVASRDSPEDGSTQR